LLLPLPLPLPLPPLLLPLPLLPLPLLLPLLLVLMYERLGARNITIANYLGGFLQPITCVEFFSCIRFALFCD